MSAAETMPEPIAAGIYEDLDEDVYHADAGSLSSSGIKTLLLSPRRFHYEREHPRKSTKSMDRGSIVHKLVLGRGALFDVLDFKDRRTNDCKAAEQESRGAGRIPILAHEFADAEEMVRAVREHPVAGPLFTNGRPELSAFAHDEPTGVLRRCRFDWLRDDGISIDLKTTGTSAEPTTFGVGKTSLSYGYHVSAPHYIDTGRDAGLDVRGMLHVFVEDKAPYLISVVELDVDAIDLGRQKVRRALEIFRDCTDSGVWPDWTDHHEPIASVGLPGYAYKGDS